MSEDNPLEARITELEIKISYAEDMLDALNRTAFSQQQQIDQLIAQIRTLRDQVQATAPTEPRSLGDELPPHY
ncbi:MAG TPA: SlyX family protein [Azonexus sp.]|jgi:SlyX protein|nr:SlyX family protein [Azonexus sp.]